MKSYSLITAGLMAVGLVSSASAQTVVHLTGSTAYRAVVFAACTTPGVVFDANGVAGSLANPITVGAGANNGVNDIVYRGYKGGVLYDLVCEFTGSEAGIAATTGLTTLSNDTPGSNGGNGVNGDGTSPLPGVPPFYLAGPNYTSTNTTAGTVVTDLTMADTSQAVSLTPPGSVTGSNLRSFGVMGIVTFEWLKTKSTHNLPDWNHLLNVTHPVLSQVLGSGVLPARILTGVPTDNRSIVVIGRNKGSGTRVNTLLDTAYGVTTPVDQFGINTDYGTPDVGVLTQHGTITFTDANVSEVGNDGFDGGSAVSACLKCDNNSASFLPIGYLGMSDAVGFPAASGGAVGSGAVSLTLDGVAEGNFAVENAQYSFWGHENLYGRQGLLDTDAGGILGNALKTGLPNELTALALGTVAAQQDTAIPLALMHAEKTGDTGFPFFTH